MVGDNYFDESIIDKMNWSPWVFEASGLVIKPEIFQNQFALPRESTSPIDFPKRPMILALSDWIGR